MFAFFIRKDVSQMEIIQDVYGKSTVPNQPNFRICLVNGLHAAVSYFRL